MAAVTGAVVAAGGAAYSARKQAKAAKGQGAPAAPAWLQRASEDATRRAEALSRRAYTPFAGQRVAGLGANEQQASELAQGLGARYAPFEQRLGAGFSRGALEQFENPYLDRVLGARRRAIGEEFGRQSAELSRTAASRDAFRRGRTDLAQSRLGEARLRALDEAEGAARAGAFDAALGAYFQQGQQDIGAFGQVQQAAGQQIGALGETGALERNIRQAGLDFDYGQFLEGRDWEVNNMGPLLEAIRTAQGTSQGSGGGGSGDRGWGAAAGLLGTALTTWGGPKKTTAGQVQAGVYDAPQTAQGAFA